MACTAWPHMLLNIIVWEPVAHCITQQRATVSNSGPNSNLKTCRAAEGHAKKGVLHHQPRKVACTTSHGLRLLALLHQVLTAWSPVPQIELRVQLPHAGPVTGLLPGNFGVRNGVLQPLLCCASCLTPPGPTLPHRHDNHATHLAAHLLHQLPDNLPVYACTPHPPIRCLTLPSLSVILWTRTCK